LDELDRLRTWYEYFQDSFSAMELELARRRAYELEINRKVEALRAQLQEEIGREHEKRLTFNE